MGKVTSTGYVADKLDDIFSGLVSKFKGIYGDDILTDADDPDGQMIGIFAQMRADIEGVILAVYQANDPDNATGTWLEQKVAFSGIRRRGASYSILPDVLLAGTAKKTLSAGAIVRDGNNVQWITQTNATFGADGTVKTDFRSSELGQYSVDADTELEIVTVTNGWTSAKTTVAATLGEEEETDPELLARFYKARARASQNCIDGTVGDLYALPGVTDVVPLENRTSKADDNGVTPYSVNYVVEGGDNTQIAQAIYDNWPGTGLQGAVSVDIIRYSGNTISIPFDRPTPVDITAKISIGRRANFTYVDTQSVINAVVALAYKTGASVYASDVTEAVNAISGVYVREVVLARDGDTPAGVLSVEIAPREKARFLATGVTVTIVEDTSS
ncbi:baseplate J/gp47 family protein [Enterobacteriaceae bacterium ML5]|nr:baseplate J/gp47 family protein [Enterobacteriaceae bacterium ML5]